MAKVTVKTAFTERESNYGRAGIIKFTRVLNSIETSVLTVHVKTWEEDLISGPIGSIDNIALAVVHNEKLLEVERTYGQPSIQLEVDGAKLYVDWSTTIRDAMGLHGSNSYQESKNLWKELPKSERDTYNRNAIIKVQKALSKKGQPSVELVLFD